MLDVERVLDCVVGDVLCSIVDNGLVEGFFVGFEFFSKKIKLIVYSQWKWILPYSMFRIIKASGKIPALCMARPWTLVLGKPERMKLFFSF